MKGLFESYFYKISNLLARNKSFFVDKNHIETEPDEGLDQMSYSDYIKYINDENNKKASPLQPDVYSI